MSKIQEAFAQFYTSCTEKHAPSQQQQRTAASIINCRTAALGANTYVCDECSHVEVHYNSCRNRHCPTCQGINRATWVDARSRDILKAPYFHVVFTMPSELHSMIYQNQELLYALMYKAVGETISELCWDRKYLGAQPGFFSILHTWGQDLHYHPHIHTVVLAGGLTKLNQWRSSSKKFFIPVKVLAKKFRGKFLYYLKQYYRRELLHFYGNIEHYREAKSFKKLLDLCYAKDWYTYTKRTFSGPLAVVKYLGRYTHRIAISNNRIASVDEHSVSFTIKDYKTAGKTKLLTLTGVEFIRRFLMHILPKGFVKIRYYGILANRNKKSKLLLCRRLTQSPSCKPRFEGLNTIEIVCLLLGRDVSICPVCGRGKLTPLSSICPGLSP